MFRAELIRTIKSAIAAFTVLLVVSTSASAFETRARSIWVYDIGTDTVLLEKEAQTPLPPASMSKLMTVNMLFEALRDGRVTLDTQFSVSTRAKSMGGSTMFLNETDRPTVEDLIQGIIVLSGNDACVVVAEGLAGTEDNFARLMNERAKTLGLDNSTFANASGWPNPAHRMSTEDLGLLAARLIKEFPEYYGYFGQQEFPYDNRAPQNRFNRNPLLKLGIGADGLKTGHTQEAGYGLVGSATQGARRIVFVLSGMESEAERAQESERVVNWAFRQFVERQVVTEGQQFATAPVWMGDQQEVLLVAKEDTTLLLPAQQGKELSAEVQYRSPIEAPVQAGDAIGDLVVSRGDLPPVAIPLVSDRSISRGGFLPRLRTAAKVLAAKFAVASGLGVDDAPVATE